MEKQRTRLAPETAFNPAEKELVQQALQKRHNRLMLMEVQASQPKQNPTFLKLQELELKTSAKKNKVYFH